MKLSLGWGVIVLTYFLFADLVVGLAAGENQLERHVASCIDLNNAITELSENPTIIVINGFLQCADFQWDNRLEIKGSCSLVGGMSEKEGMPVGIDFGDKSRVVELREGSELKFTDLKIFQQKMDINPLEINFFQCAPGSSLTLSQTLSWSRACSYGVKSYHVEFGGSKQHYLPDFGWNNQKKGRKKSQWTDVDIDSKETRRELGIRQKKVSIGTKDAVACCGACDEAEAVIESLNEDVMRTATLLATDVTTRIENNDNDDDEDEMGRAFPLLGIITVIMAAVAILLLSGWSFILCLPRSRHKVHHIRKDTAQLGFPQKREPMPDCAVIRTKSQPQELTLEDIEIGSPLGKGAFGKVYKGHHNGKAVAVKVFEHDGNMINDTGEPMEVHVARSISHPNVVKTLLNQTRDRASVHASLSISSGFPLHSLEMDSNLNKKLHGGSSGGEGANRKDTDDFSYMACHLGSESDRCYRTWIVMEYCDMGSLAAGIASNMFHNPKTKEPNIPFQIMTMFDIAKAMTYLHSQRIVHGDLKAHNVLLKSSKSDLRGFCCKVCDFGFSRGISNEAYIETFTCGTVSHMPPELLKDGMLSTAADVYSFAILMWELFSGMRPYRNMRHSEIVLRVADGIRQPIPANCPPALASLINDCWQEDFSVRPSFRTITERLRDILQSMDTDVVITAPPTEKATDSCPNSGTAGIQVKGKLWQLLSTRETLYSSDDEHGSCEAIDDIWQTQEELTESLVDINYTRWAWESPTDLDSAESTSSGTSLKFKPRRKSRTASKGKLWRSGSLSGSMHSFKSLRKKNPQKNKAYVTPGHLRSSSCCEVLTKDQS